MPNRAEIRDWVRQHTLIEEDDYADSKINAVINQGIRDLATQFDWPFLQTSYSFNVEEGQSAYPLPADFSHLAAAVRSSSGDVMVEITPQEAWSEYGGDRTSDNPRFFYLWGNEFVVAPAKSGERPMAVTLYYFRHPHVLSADTAEPEFDAQFHMLLAEFAAAKVWEREEDLTRSNYYMDRYYAGVERMARYYLKRTDHFPLVIGEPRKQRSGPRMPWLEV